MAYHRPSALKQQGAILLLVLIVSMILSLYAVTTATTVQLQWRALHYAQLRQQVFWAAEAGLHTAEKALEAHNWQSKQSSHFANSELDTIIKKITMKPCSLRQLFRITVCAKAHDSAVSLQSLYALAKNPAETCSSKPDTISKRGRLSWNDVTALGIRDRAC